MKKRQRRLQRQPHSQHSTINSKAIFVTIIFVAVVGFLATLGVIWLINIETLVKNESNYSNGMGSLSATVEIVDENSSVTAGVLTKRINEFVAQCEMDFWELGYKVTKAVIPAGAVREIDLYISGYSGFVKTVTDRGAGVTAEDFDRMVKYLKGIGVADFTYIDVRIEGKGYYKGL